MVMDTRGPKSNDTSQSSTPHGRRLTEATQVTGSFSSVASSHRGAGPQHQPSRHYWLLLEMPPQPLLFCVCKRGESHLSYQPLCNQLIHACRQHMVDAAASSVC